jgi:hypothetical protein
MIMEKTIATKKDMLIVDSDDCLASYESQFRAYHFLLTNQRSHLQHWNSQL